jgi:hypothetical protein
MEATEHLWGVLKRVSHAALTAEGMSSATFRSIGLRLLCAVLGLGDTQPGRVRKSGAVLSAVAQIDWVNVPSQRWGCEAALDLYALAVRLDSMAIPPPPPFDALPRLPMWSSLQAFRDWLPDPPLAQWNSISSTQLPITSQRGQGGIRISIQSAKLAGAGRSGPGHQ